MSSVALSEAFRAVYGCNAKEIRELSMKANDLPSTKALTELESKTQKEMIDLTKDVEKLCVETTQQKESELRAARSSAEESMNLRRACEVEVDQLRLRIKSLQSDVQRRQAALAALGTNDAAAKRNVSPQQRAAEYLRLRAELSSDLRYNTWLLRNLADLSDSELRSVDLLDAAPVLEDWPRTVENTERKLVELKRSAASSSLDDAAAWNQDVEEQWEAVKRARAVQDVRLTGECTRRQEKDHNVQNFLMEQTKMLQWCREQTVQLENLHQPDHVQEFCASLQNNNSTMEANFLVLSDMAEPLLPNGAVKKALTDVSREWFQLQVYTYERLRQCLMDQHAQSKLEDTLRSWSNYFFPVKEYFHTVEGLLLQPTEEEAVAYLTPLLESVRTLQNEAVPHQLIVDHLADFSLRMQCIQENYTALRPSIFSTLSLMYPTLAVSTSAHNAAWSGRTEYNQKITDLADWVDVHGQSDVWESVRQRVERARQIVEEDMPTS